MNSHEYNRLSQLAYAAEETIISLMAGRDVDTTSLEAMARAFDFDPVAGPLATIVHSFHLERIYKTVTPLVVEDNEETAFDAWGKRFSAQLHAAHRGFLTMLELAELYNTLPQIAAYFREFARLERIDPVIGPERELCPA